MSKTRIAKTSKAAQVAESHLSLGTWGWVMLVGSGGGGGIIALIKGLTEKLAWYDIALITLFAVLCAAFVATGFMSFLANIRNKNEQLNAFQTGQEWKTSKYKDGMLIDGGTHYLSEIFKSDRIRMNMVFRNCVISGPGMAVFTHGSTSRCNFHMERMDTPMILNSGQLNLASHLEFLNCQFENVTFTSALLYMGQPIGEINVPTMRLEVN